MGEPEIFINLISLVEVVLGVVRETWILLDDLFYILNILFLEEYMLIRLGLLVNLGTIDISNQSVSKLKLVYHFILRKKNKKNIIRSEVKNHRGQIFNPDYRQERNVSTSFRSHVQFYRELRIQ